MTIEHKNISDADIHNPKGFASAAASTKLTKNAAGNLEWVSDATVPSDTARYGELITADGSSSSAYGQRVWKDIIGVYQEDSSGATRPTKAAFKGNVDAWAFSVGDSIDYTFHVPHDYAVGTDIYLHVHWGHNGTAISGNLVWNAGITYAHRTAGVPYGVFGNNITPQISSNDISGAMTSGNFPRWCHVVEEIQLSAALPSANQLATADISVDGLVLVHLAPSVIPSITGGAPNEPFLFTLDIHYQADIEGTKKKDPNYYS